MAASVKLRGPTRAEKSKIYNAARTGDIHTIQELASSGVDVTGIVDDELQRTALHWAALYGHTNIVDVLVKSGADVNMKDELNKTALHSAGRYGHNNIVTFLLSHGARVNDVDRLQMTALHWAASNGHTNTVDVLVKSGADVNMKDEYNYTALHKAGEEGHNNIVTFLLSHGARVNDVDYLQMTALHWAASNGHTNTVDVLVKNGADVNMKDKGNMTALHRAGRNGHNNIVTFLLSHGARVNDVDKLQMTALHWAALNDHTNTVDVLVKSGADVNMKDDKNRTPLECAVEHGHSEVIEYFIKNLKIDTTKFNEYTQRRIRELLKETEKEQNNSNDHPGSHDLQQGATAVLSQSKYKPYKPDEPAARLQQLQFYGTTQLTTVNKAHQSAGKIQLSQKIDKQKNTADERVEELEKVFAEIQILKNQVSLTQKQQSNTDTYLKDQLSLTQQQLSEVQKDNAYLKDQLSVNQQQLSEVQKDNAYLKDQLSVNQQQLSEVQKDNAYLKDQLSVNQQQLSDLHRANAYLKDQLSLTQQQLLGVQSMMTCSRVWVVSRDHFTIGKEIGRGAWATVHETMFRGATVAAKCLHHLITSPRTRQLFQREMEMALQCQHQNIVTFLGATLEGPPVILMELMDTSLRSAYEHGNIKDHQVLGILCDTASALHFLHTRPDPVIHRDVSSANVLLKILYNGEWLAKLGDLGTAKIQQQAATAGPGAIAYGAPEAADFTKHSPKMDVYSYGVLVLEVLTKTHPFQMVDALKAQVQQQFPQYRQLVTGCTNHQSSNRPTMYDVIEQLDRINAARL